MDSIGSKGSGSDDEPLVPDDFDDEFLSGVLEKVPEITKALRQKDTHENADNVQRLVICCNRYKSELRMEQQHTEDLKNDIYQLHERLEASANISKMDQDIIAELRNVIEGAWKQKDAAQMREQLAHDELQKLREQVDQLEDTIQKLTDKRSVLQSKRDDNKERENLNAEIKELNKRLQIQRLYTNEVEQMTQTLEEKNKALLKILDETSTEAYNCKKRYDVLQKEANQLRSDEIKYTEMLAQIKAKSAQLTKMKVRQNLQILALRTNLEQLNTQHNNACNKLAKITVDLEYATQERDKYKRDLNQRTNLLKMREDEIIKLRQDNSKLARSQESTVRKYATLDEAKSRTENENFRLKSQLSTQDKEIESIRRLLHSIEKSNENLTKERDAVKRDLIAEHRSAQEMNALLQEAQHELRSLKDNQQTMESKHKKLRDELNKLKKEKDKKMDEIQVWMDKIDALQSDIHLKENYVIELKRTITDMEVKCAKFQAQHEGLINDKNSMQRNVQLVEEERDKLKQQIANLQNTNELLRGKITYRDAEIGKLQLQIDRLEKERRMLRANIRNSKLGHQHTRAELLEKKKENDRFSKSLQEDAHKLMHLKKEFDKVLNEKNTVFATLTKRNDDYAQLKDNLDNLQSVYDQTEKRYSQCQDDMRIMRIEINHLRTECDVLRKDRENAADLRQELLQMHRQLNQERIKARALQDEMLTPMNIHRWRNLRGKDPVKMDLIHQIQVLRKQLLNQNIAALEQERALEESQQLYAALREFMLKLPSHKIKAELNEVKATLTNKDRKLKALKAELNIREIEEKSNIMKWDELKNDLANTKTQLTQEKKKKQKLLEERQLLVQCFSAPPNMQRTLGAGFKIVGGF